MRRASSLLKGDSFKKGTTDTEEQVLETIDDADENDRVISARALAPP